MAWIELHQTLREHKKMFACADALNLSRIEMIGTLVSLWLWALDNAQDGSLEGVSDKTIARVCDFPEKKAGKLMEALNKHGWLDKSGDHYVIHDWYDYAGKLMERREKDRKRKNNSKNKQADFQGSSSGNPAEVHGNSHATVPNRTLPYPTVPDITGAAGDNRARETATVEELLSIGIKPGEFPPIHPDRVRWVQAITVRLFDKYRNCAAPGPWDCRKVFELAYTPEKADVLDYAFEQAAISGKTEDWRYIEGIMNRLNLRGINTVAEARVFDAERPDLEGDV